MKLPTRPTPTLDTLPDGVQRLTLDGQREVFYTEQADGPWTGDALCDYFGSTGPVDPAQARPRHDGDFAYWFEADARKKEK